jgi:hypothetical protein
MFPRDIWKRIRSFDPHLHAIRKGVELRKPDEKEGDWIRAFIVYFLE